VTEGSRRRSEEKSEEKYFCLEQVFVFGEWRCEKRWSSKFLWFVGFVIGGDDLMKEEQRICFVLFFTRPERQQKAGCCCFMRLWRSFGRDLKRRNSPVLKDCSERNERRIHRTWIVLILLSYCSRVGLDNVDDLVGENVERWMC
jgi:hypothetical protein